MMLPLSTSRLSILGAALAVTGTSWATPGPQSSAARAASPSALPGANEGPLAWGDFDGDHLSDAVSVLPDGSLRLFRNTGDGALSDITEAAGLGDVVGASAALLADLDGDGRADLFLGGQASSRLLLSTGTSFLDISAGSSLAELAGVRTVRALDYDDDGRIDLLVSGLAQSALMHGLGAGLFERVEVSLAGERLAWSGWPAAATRSESASAPGITSLTVEGANQLSFDVPLAGFGGLGGSGSGASASTSGSAVPVGPGTPIAPLLACAGSLLDQATSSCLDASSVPTLGMLYPLSNDFFVQSGTGNVGIGTTNPATKLNIDGPGDAGLSGDGIFMIGSKTARNYVFDGEEFMTRNNGAPSKMSINYEGGDVTIAGSGAASNVGIGTQNPSTKFHVAGSSRIEGRLTVNQDFVAEGQVALGRSSVYSNVALEVQGQGVDDYVVDANSDDIDGFATAVFAETSFGGGVSPWGAAVWAKSNAAAYDAVYAEGDMTTSGAKAFVQPHPSDSSREIRFVCLEGNESGTYFRGKTTLVGGVARIQVPEDFRLVSEAEGLTVQLTAMGPAQVWLASYDLNEVLIAGTDDIEVHYMINGVRRGFADFETMRTNTHFRPRTAGERFGNQYPADLQAILIENGTLNSDLTPNEATAARNGWTLVDPQLELDKR